MASEGDGNVSDINVMSMIQNLFLNDSTSPQRNSGSSLSQTSPLNSCQSQSSNTAPGLQSQQQVNQVKTQSLMGVNHQPHHSSPEGSFGPRNTLFASFRSDNHFFSSASDASNNISFNDSASSSDFALNGRSFDFQDNNHGNQRGILSALDASLNLNQSHSPLPPSFFSKNVGGQPVDLMTGMTNTSSLLLIPSNGPSSSSSASPSTVSPPFSQQTFQGLSHQEMMGSLRHPSQSTTSSRSGLIGSSTGIPGTIGQRSVSVMGDSLLSPAVGSSGRVYSPIDGLGFGVHSSGSSGQLNALLKNPFPGQSNQTLRPEAQLEKFESHMRSISNDIQSTVQMHINGLLGRKEHLLQQLETIRKIYLAIFQHRQLPQSTLNGSNNLLPNESELIDMLILPSISFTKPDHALFKAVTSMGFLTTPAFAPYCSASGDGLEASVPGQSMSFVIVTKNCFNEELLLGRESIIARIFAFAEPNFYSGDHQSEQQRQQQFQSRSGTLDSGFGSVSAGDFTGNRHLGIPTSGSSPCLASSSPSASQLTLNNLTGSNGLVKIPCNTSVTDHNNGKYTVTYSLPPGGSSSCFVHVEITVMVNGICMTGCPFKVKVQTQHRQSWKKVISFGTEGNAVGQFCRPWGVAIAKLPSSLLLPSFTASNETSPVQQVSLQDCHDSQAGTSSSHSSKSSFSQSISASPSSNGSQVESQTDGDSPSSLSPTNTNNNTSNTSTGTTSSLPGLPSNPSTNHSHHQANNSNNNNSPVTGYLVAVADRSNNRIQVFKMDEATSQITTLFAFGSGPGTGQGQFDRPAGLCFNISLGHLIVADKDNHRVQVFDLTGRFLLKFGEKGSRAGQFCYPWDIESCPSTHQLVVSDTRNRRIQLFSPYGQYLTHFSQPLDSPRGVGFFADSKILVSDFNKHRLMIFERNPVGNTSGGMNVAERLHQHTAHLHPHHQQQHHSSHGSSHGSSAPSTPTPPSSLSTRFIGFGEGSGWGEFLRPQGIAINGHYAFCSDSRNNRICLYNLVTQTFEYLSEDLGLDRPSGIAVLDNIMIVVDFGNNRLVVCRR